MTRYVVFAPSSPNDTVEICGTIKAARKAAQDIANAAMEEDYDPEVWIGIIFEKLNEGKS